MATNEINLTLKITESGDLKLVGKKAEQAAAGLDKAGKSARNADRNLKGAAQASSNSTKNFSKMAQGISGGIVPAYATLAAQVFAVSAAFNFLKDAGSLQLLQKGQTAYAAATGTSLRGLTKDIQEATEAQLGFRDAAQAAAIGTSAGLDPTQITQIAKAAKDASTVLGRDLTDSFNRLVRGITKAEPELLDELGIILRLEEATENYKRALNIQGELNTFQRSQAVANEVLTQAEEKYGKLLAVTGGGANQFAKLATAFEDIVNDIRNFAVDFLTPIATALQKMPELIIFAFAPFGAQVLSAALPGLDRISDKLNEFGETAAKNATKAKKELSKALEDDEAIKKSAVLQAALKQEVQANAQARLKDVKAHERSLLQKLKKGEQLSNAQIAQVRKNLQNEVRGYQIRDNAIRGHLHKTLNEMERSNNLATKKIQGFWAVTQFKVEKAFSGMGRKANTVFAGMVGAARAAGAAISFALSAVSWISLIATLGALAFSFFRSGKEAEDSTPKYDYLKSKLEDLGSETKEFIEVQNILNDTYETGNKVLEAYGKRLANVSNIKLSQDINREELKALSDQLIATRTQAEEAIGTITPNVEARVQQEISPFSSRAGAGMGIRLPTSQETEDLKVLTEARKTAAKSLQDYLSSKEGELTTTEAGLQILLKDKEALEGITNARFQSNSAVKAYLEQLDATNSLEEMNIEKLLERRDAVQEISAKISELTRLETENSQALRTAEQRVFPISEYDQLLVNMREEKRLLEEIAATYDPTDADSKQLTENEEKRLKYLNERFGLIQSLATTEHKASVARLKADRALITLGKGSTKLVKEELAINIKLRKLSIDQVALREKIRQADILSQQATAKIATLREEGDLAAAERLELEQAARLRTMEITQEELALSEAKTAELERQLDLNARIVDTAAQAMESGLAREIAKVIKGEEKSIKDAVLAIVKSIGEAIADELARAAARGIMKLFGFKTAADDMKEKMMEANDDAKAKMIAANSDGQTKITNAHSAGAKAMEVAIKHAISTSTINTSPGGAGGCLKLCEESITPTLPTEITTPGGSTTTTGGDILGSHPPGQEKTAEEKGFGRFLSDAFGLGGVFDYLFGKGQGGGPSSGGINTHTAEGMEEVVVTATQRMEGVFRPFIDSLGKLFDKDTPFLQGLGNVFQTGLQGFDQIFGDLLNGFMRFFGGGGGTDGMGFVSTIMSIFGFANGGVAKGGFRSMAYANGGIARKPTLGLVGEGRYDEAIVPLPDGKSIPVSMGKGVGQHNNVVINVNIDKDGNASQDEAATGTEAAQLGQAISVAVQRELLIQKRSGGMLNPHGVA